MPFKASVLVTAAGTIVAQGIIKSLKLANLQKDNPVSYRIIAVDMSAQAAGLYRCDLGLLVPPFSSSDYIDSIIGVCKRQSIDAIFVGSDEELLPIALAKERLQEETGAIAITNPPNAIITASDKWKTFEFLKKSNLPCPESSLPENQESFIHEFGFPLIIKPREGHGSLHLYLAHDREELGEAMSAINKAGWHPMLQEYLEGEDMEFTSGVTVDRTGNHVMSSISMKRVLKSGQTYKAFIDDFHDVRRPAEETAVKLGSIGPVNIQARWVKDKAKVFEINPRFSGTCPMRAVAGINEPDIIFRNIVLGETIKVSAYQKLVCLRYWNEVYVPYSAYENATSSGKIEDANSFIPNYF